MKLKRCTAIWVVTLFTILLPAIPAIAAKAQVTFLPNSDPLLFNYTIHYGTNSGDYTSEIDMISPELVDGNVVAVIEGLEPGETYYFSVTAYNGDDISDPSNELSYTVPLPSPPVAENIALQVIEDTLAGGNLLAVNPETDTMLYQVISEPAHGTLNANVNNGAFTFTPFANYHGSDSFTYCATNGAGNSNIATVTITISPENDAPNAQTQSISISEDTTFSGQFVASDVDDDTLNYSLISSGLQGNAVITSTVNGYFSYTPNPDFSGTDTFSFRVSDGALNSNEATVTVTVLAVNDAPVANSASLSTIEDNQISGQLSGYDVDGDVISYIVTGTPAKGSVVLTNPENGSFTYTPTLNETGSDWFTFRVNDSQLNSQSATVSISIVEVNDPPVATGATFITSENTAVSAKLSASDPDDDPLQFSIVSNGTKGNVVITNHNDGSFTYTPDANESGGDTFSYLVNDGTVNSAEVDVNITIDNVNDPPIALTSSFSTSEDTVYNGQLQATDPDGNELTYIIVATPVNGNIVLSDPSNGSFAYTPNANFSGADSFSFQVSDGALESSQTTVEITVAPINDPPVAHPLTISTLEDMAVNGQLNGSDVEGNSLSYSIVTNGSSGVAAITNAQTGTFTYTPDDNLFGTDSFTFKVNDGLADSQEVIVNVTIDGVNDQPTAVSTTFTTDEGVAYSSQLSAEDIDGDLLVYSIVTNGGKGVVVFTNSGDGSFTYTPDQNANGQDSFTFRVNDGTVHSDTATVDVSITSTNMSTSVADSSVTTRKNNSVTGEIIAFDEDGDQLNFTLVTHGVNGSVIIPDPATGTYIYTPNPDFTGEDSFTFRVNDGEANSNIGTVTVTVLESNVITKVFGNTPGAHMPGTLTDTYVNINSDVNEAGDTLRTYSWSPSELQGPANSTIIQADLSSIPTFAVIAKAELRLFQTGANGESEYSNSIHRISGMNPVLSETTGFNAASGMPWSPVESGTTHNDIPLGLADIESYDDTIVLLNKTGYRSWDITSMVQHWITNPGSNYGMLIKGEQTEIETGRSFGSNENAEAALRPELILHYNLVPPAPELIRVDEIR